MSDSIHGLKNKIQKLELQNEVLKRKLEDAQEVLSLYSTSCYATDPRGYEDGGPFYVIEKKDHKFVGVRDPAKDCLERINPKQEE